MTTILFDADKANFDPLGKNRAHYYRTLDALPAELKHKLHDVRFGLLTPVEPDPDAGKSEEDKIADRMSAEMNRMLATGQAVIVDKEGNPVEIPEWKPPERVVGEGSLYGFFVEFGGGQTVFVETPPAERWTSSWDPSMPDEAIALMCVRIR